MARTSEDESLAVRGEAEPAEHPPGKLASPAQQEEPRREKAGGRPGPLCWDGAHRGLSSGPGP